MSDRGDYRSIRRVLLDGPDFQKLPGGVRWVFVLLKLNFGAAGIEVWYPAELIARLAAQSGGTTEVVIASLDALEKAGWIQREGNIVWIIGQLANDPHMRQVDPKHRKAVQRHVCGLPRLDIVRQYVHAQLEWFTTSGSPTGNPSEGLAWAFEGLPVALRSTEKEEEKEKETENKSLVSSGDDTGAESAEKPKKYSDEFEAAWSIYPPRLGGNSKHDASVAWRARCRAGVPVATLHEGTVRYRAFCEAMEKVGSPFVMHAATFYGPGGHYLETWEITADPVVRSFNRSSGSAQEYAAASADWALIKENNLTTSWPPAELYRIGDAMVSAGRFPDRESFLGWFRMLKPVDLKEARTDKWAVEQIIERRKTPHRAAS